MSDLTTQPMLLWDDSPRTRVTDPETSHEAADTNAVKDSQAEVWRIIREFGPVDDFEIYDAHHPFGMIGRRAWSPQRLRTARAELVEQGLVVFTGVFHLSPSGRRTRVWQAA